MTTTNTAVKKFAWSAENFATAANLYAQSLGGTFDEKAKEIKFNDAAPSAEQHTEANAEKALNAIAVEIGAKSGRAIRGKLAKEGVYIALEPQAKVSTSTRTSKGQYVRSIASGLGLDLETVQTLDKVNLEALEALTKGINSVLTAASMPAIEVK